MIDLFKETPSWQENVTHILFAEDGSITYEMVLFRVFSRHMPADVRANQYLMQNRNPNRWKNTKFIVPGGGDNEKWPEIMKSFGEAIQGKFVDKPE